ncbi:MAG: hypothetical protein ACOX17_02545 [Christensenellales bacterium]|jgi:uncharacterized membrane protein YesL
MFEGLFQKLYGGGRKTDLKKEDLPTNLFGIFADRLWNQLWGIIKANFLFCLFMIPLFLWIWYNVTVAIVEINRVAEATGSLLAGDSFRQIMNIFMLGLIPAFIISSPGMAGISYVLKQYARGEHVFFLSDFWDSIKVNWKQTLGMMLMNAVLLNILWFGSTIYAAVTLNVNLVFVLRTLLILAVAVFLSINLYFWPLMVTYQASFGQLLKTSFLLAVARLPLSLLFLALSFAPLAALLWLSYVWGYGFLVLIAYYLILGFGLTGFINTFYGNVTIDRYLKTDGAADEGE